MKRALIAFVQGIVLAGAGTASTGLGLFLLNLAPTVAPVALLGVGLAAGLAMLGGACLLGMAASIALSGRGL